MPLRLFAPQNPVSVYYELGKVRGRIACEVEKGCPVVLAITIPNANRLGTLFEFEGLDGQCKAFAPGQQADAIKSANPNAPAVPNQPDSWFIACNGLDDGRFEFNVLVNAQDPIWKAVKAPAMHTLEFPTHVLRVDGVGPGAWQKSETFRLRLSYRGRFNPLHSAFAIDFGTTNTCAAYWGDEDGRPHLVNYRGHSSIPSIIMYRSQPDGQASLAHSIGVEAEQALSTGDERCRRRRIKQQMDLPLRKRELDLGLPKKRTVDEVYEDFVREYLSSFEREHQRRLVQVKATYPPEYPARSREAVMNVYAKLAIDVKPEKGKSASRLFGIDEASAAAVYYFWRRFKDDHNGDLAAFAETCGKEHQVMVFDMGGGTTDISIVSIVVQFSPRVNALPNGVNIKVLGTASLNNLGGDNFTVHVLRALKCRLALAAARKFKPSPQQESAKSSRAQLERLTALSTLLSRADEFQQILDQLPRANETENEMEKAFEEIERLADLVIPTRSARLEQALEKSPDGRSRFEINDATNTFLKLWSVAEQYKLELVKSESVQLDFAGLGIHESEVLQALNLTDVELAGIRLRRETDLYRRIRPLIRRAVLTCRSVMRDLSVNLTALRTIQLVGNSCRIPLIESLFVSELEAELPLVKQRIRFNPEEAKSCVALGACVASQINDFGIKAGYDIKFEPAPERLGWEIGSWDRGLTDFKVLFDSKGKPSQQPTAEGPDDPRLRQIQIFRRRPASEGQREMEPELMGGFILDPSLASAEVDHPAPPGVLRYRLVSYNDVALIRGNLLYPLQLPQAQQAAREDPYSGWH